MSQPLPSSWSKPVADWFAALEQSVRQANGDRAAFEAARKAVEALPELLGKMDVAALTDWFEAVLGAFAVAGALSSKLDEDNERTVFLSADPFDFGIKLAPFAEAVTRIDARRPIGSAMRSAEWEMLPRALRDRAQFSAGVESVQLLNEIQARARRRLSIETEKLGNGNERFESRDTFISEIRDMAKALGVDTTQGPGEYGTIKDIQSNERLALIYEMQTSQAAEFARRKADLSKVPLNLYPAYRFQRIESREKPRGEAYWQNRWSEAGAAVGWEGASEQPMVALKTSPIWSELSRFGNPHPPFDYNSGMGTVDVDRATAVKLGLIQEDDVLEAKPEDFNDGLTASAQGVDPELLKKLQGMLGDAIEIRGDEVRWSGDTGEMPTPFAEKQINPDPAFRALFGDAANDVARMAKWANQQKDGEYLMAIKPSGVLYDRPVRWTENVPEGEKPNPDRVYHPPAAGWGTGTHLLHNHRGPKANGSGRSFSPRDIFTASKLSPASESIVVGGTIKTITPLKSWPTFADKEELKASFKNHVASATKESLRSAIASGSNMTKPQKGFDEGIADSAWALFAKEHGMQFNVTE